MLLHEALIDPPGHTRRFHRVAFGSNRDLMGMKVMQPQLIEQRFLDDFVREQEGLDPYRLQQPAKGARKVAIDPDPTVPAARTPGRGP